MADAVFTRPLTSFIDEEEPTAEGYGELFGAIEQPGSEIALPEASEDLLPELTQRLFAELDRPTQTLPPPRRHNTFNRVMLALAAAFGDPAVREGIVFPLIREQREFPQRQAVFAAQQEDERLRRVQSLASLLGVQEDRRARLEQAAERIAISRGEASRRQEESTARIARLGQLKEESDARIAQINRDLKRIPANTLGVRIEGQIRVKQRERDRLFDPITGRVRRGEEARVEEIQAEIDTLEQRLDDVIGQGLRGDESPAPTPEKKRRVGLFGGE